MVEYSVILVLVAIAAIVTLSLVGNTASLVFSNVVCSIKSGGPNIFPGDPCVSVGGPSPTPSVAPSPSPSAGASPTPSAEPPLLPLTGGKNAYVLNQQSGSVTRIDAAGVTTDLALSGTSFLISMAITPDGSTVYVLDEGDGSLNSAGVHVISTATFTDTATIPIHNLLGTIITTTQDADTEQIVANNTAAYVTAHSGCSETAPVTQGNPCHSGDAGWSIMRINNATHAVSYIGWNDDWCGGCGREDLSGIALSADGNTAWVADANNTDITKISGLNTAGTVAVGGDTSVQNGTGNPFNVRNVVVTATSGYVSEQAQGGVYPFSLSGTITFGTFTDLSTAGFFSARNMTASSSQLYVTADNGNVVKVFAQPSGTPSDITTASRPTGLFYDSADGTIWVTNKFSNSVSVIDGPTNTEVANSPISVGGRPIAVVVG